MNKETIKFLWGIYSDLIKQQQDGLNEEYPLYDISTVIEKIKNKLDEELK